MFVVTRVNFFRQGFVKASNYYFCCDIGTLRALAQQDQFPCFKSKSQTITCFFLFFNNKRRIIIVVSGTCSTW